MSTFSSSWPYPDLPRVFGAREAVVHEEHHTAARHVRPKFAGRERQRRLELARDAVSLGVATPAEWAALTEAVASLRAAVEAPYKPQWFMHETEWDRVFVAEIGASL